MFGGGVALPPTASQKEFFAYERLRRSSGEIIENCYEVSENCAEQIFKIQAKTLFFIEGLIEFRKTIFSGNYILR